jgi:hypothetical protein
VRVYALFVGRWGGCGAPLEATARDDSSARARVFYWQELDPELLATVRAPLVSGYADKQGIEALLSLLLQKVLIERPDDPVAYLVDVLGVWKPRMIVMLGPPASGKYTLACALAERLALEHVSPADLVEGMIASDTVIGGEMQRCLDRGDLVPDDLLGTNSQKYHGDFI